MHVKKGDKVIVLSGKDKGKTGEVTKAFPKLGKIVVAGVNKFKRHERPKKTNAKGQIVEREMPLYVSKVALAGKVKESKKETKSEK